MGISYSYVLFINDDAFICFLLKDIRSRHATSSNFQDHMKQLWWTIYIIEI